MTLTNIAMIEPWIKIAKGENVADNIRILLTTLGLPLVGLLVFLMLWQVAASNINTSLGQFPGPVEALDQARGLVSEHIAEREKAEAFYERQEARNAERVANDPDYEPKIRPYTGKPTYFDQIGTSLITVMSGDR